VAQGALLPGEPVVFLHDGHGSTRALVQAVTTVVVQRFAYDAYGNHLLADGSGLTSAADAITDLLYSGEATDPTGRQYLRARWYDPTTGCFNRLDPFAGLAHEPQSLHKYLYAHADPIMGTDPTGEAIPALLVVLPILKMGVAIAANGVTIGAAVGGSMLTSQAMVNLAFTGLAIWAGVEIYQAAPVDFDIAGILGVFSGDKPTKADSPVWQNLKPHRGQVKTNGLTGKKTRFYEWDYTHGEIEVYGPKPRVRHLGSQDPKSGEWVKPPRPGRNIRDKV